MIAISVTNYNDINLARAFVEAYQHKNHIYIHFSSNTWLEMYGEITCKHGSDLNYFLMHAENFDLFVTFSAPPNKAQLYNYTLVSFFNEIGVKTVEVQHGLFQYGINNLDDEILRCGFDDNAQGWGLPIKYPAAEVLTWLGQDGIGYLKSDRYCLTEQTMIFGEECVLIITNNNWHVYDEYDRLNLITCIVKLVSSNKEDLFVWKPHPAEMSGTVFQVLKKYNFTNLKILDADYIADYPAEKLIQSCKYGISMVSTALLDFEFANKQVLVYQRKPVEKMLKQLVQVNTFNSPDDLLTKYKKMTSDQDYALLKTGVAKLNTVKFNNKIDKLRQQSKVHAQPNTILKYIDRLAYMRIPDPYKVVVERSFVPPLSNNNTHENGLKSMLFMNPMSTYSIEEILRSIENRIKMQSKNGGISAHNANDLLVKLDGVQKKLHDYQKSTIAYKLKKFMKKRKK